MNKKYFIPAICLLFLAACTTTGVNDLVKDGLHGQVRKVTEIAYEGVFPISHDTIFPEFSSIVWTYDKKGFLSEKSMYDNGKLVQRLIPVFQNGKLAGNSRFNGDGELMLNSTIKEVKENVFVEVCTNLEGKLFSSEITAFKNNRKVSDTLHYQTLEYISEFRYGNDGLLQAIIRKNNSGEEEYSYDYEYVSFDKLNNWILRKDFAPGPAKILKFTTVRKYEYY